MSRRKNVFRIPARMLFGIGLLACLNWFVVSRAVALSPTNQVAPASPVGKPEVRIEGFALTPGNLTIQAGTTVR